ncbi:DUF3168 domain-containing protein [Rhizobium laguerreae]|uniref:tail completion protein gp17 n=1 Tax=Rhizobium laguerreae TaxID=1076926 RepID=UPI001C909557|nr:DUF3168 domain-containing protein [Rhizobium laguerreae]MBY3257066.1 DUF3168 domain-containing protein [Rhizobium laguerreae]MBY3282427.1 DUF3168 domain-containing protein [Rhizobium laguerreae]MBY3291954.1 DUF3168 domain-containing protein [Rhizobium laguerreae]
MEAAAIIALLLADARVKAIAGDRVHFVRAPQGLPRPYGLLARASGTTDYTNEGASGLGTARLQLDGYGESYKSANDLLEAMLAVVDGFRGERSGITFKGIFIDSRRDLPASDSGNVTPLFRRSADIIIWFS